jgi:hypothetical protein
MKRRTVKGENSQTSESHEIFSSVRGKDKKQETIIPTTPKTIEHVACFVIELSATVNVRMWLAMMNTRKSSWAVPNNS